MDAGRKSGGEREGWRRRGGLWVFDGYFGARASAKTPSLQLQSKNKLPKVQWHYMQYEAHNQQSKVVPKSTCQQPQAQAPAPCRKRVPQWSAAP